MTKPHDAVITSACRTPIGKLLGALGDHGAIELGTLAVREAVKRSDLEPSDVDEVIMGNVLQAGLGQNPARQAALGAGLTPEVAALTVNKVCGSGLKAVVLAAQAIKLGDQRIILAGGMESMTNAPFLLPNGRKGTRFGDGAKKGQVEFVDAMIHDGLWDSYGNYHMGCTGEVVAQRFNVTRPVADQFALRSHQRAAEATEKGWFRDEILPVEVKGEKGPVMFEKDEGIRAMNTLQGLARLKPVFAKDGLVTAGNSSQLSDGAAAVVVMSRAEAQKRGLTPLATVTAYDTAGVRPEHVMEAPIPSVQRLLKKTNMTIDDVDLVEHNEAFATASCAVRSGLEIPDEKFNVQGGAVALGHPIGSSGARILTTLMYALKRTHKTRGIATLCLGGGNAVSMLVERE